MSENRLQSLLRPTLAALTEGPVDWAAQRARTLELLSVPTNGESVATNPEHKAAVAVGITLANHLLVAADLVRALGRGEYELTAMGREWLDEATYDGGITMDHLRQVPAFASWEEHAPLYDGAILSSETRIDEVMTWVPFFEELATKRVPYRDRQRELIGFLDELRSGGLTVTPLQDKNEDGSPFPIQEIDPFTFLGTINRSISFETRTAIANAMREEFAVEAPTPTDFRGVPVLNNMKSWFISRKSERGTDDAGKLWTVFELAVQDDPWHDPAFETALDAAFALPLIKVNLTMGLFWIRPKTFAALDSMSRQLLEIPNPTKGLTASLYRSYVQQADERDPFSVARSLQAYLSPQHLDLAKKRAPSTAPTPSDVIDPALDYWLVGATWGTDSQVDRFIQEGTWENGYEDRYLDEVRAMKPGDKIAIKSSFVQRHNLPFEFEGNTASVMRIYTTGTVTANPGTGRQVTVEWDVDAQPRDWFHFTGKTTVWHLNTSPDYPMRHHVVRLIDFVWNGVPQDLAWYAERWLAWKHGEAPEEITDLEGTEIERPPYGPESMKQDGVFAPIEELERTIDLLRRKRAIILQGPPGVGKTFMAKRIAYGLMTEKADDRVQLIQFHQSYAYDDFVRGFRPSQKTGHFKLQDGVFVRFCRRAQANPDNDYVFIIDEINRGNLSQIFGEVLMLLEADKRSPSFAVPLAYSQDDDSPFYVPKNVHVVGLMNVADRSLALVDYALRRRFAFIDLEPQFETPEFRSWLADHNVRPRLIDRIVTRMGELNQEIASHGLLGPKYRVGHSYFTPRPLEGVEYDDAWYEQVVRTEIAPLLREYWFDDAETADAAINSLLTK